MNKKTTIVIAGGGTGGHVLPALAIADAMKLQNSLVEIHFVGTQKGIETKLVPKAGYPLHFLPVSGLKNTSLLGRIKSLSQLPISFFKSVLLIMKLRPHAVLGVGGYASGPFLFVASLLHCRTFIWEPNAHPGWTNRILSRFVQTAFIVFEASRNFLKTKDLVLLGMPLRKNISHVPRAPSKKLRILVFGGSQGARGINNTVSDAVVNATLNQESWLKMVALVHQTGALDYENIKAKYEQCQAPVEAHAFLYDMDKRYAWSDLVVCRSGASTVAEIAAARKAAIFIPFPFAADDHQKKNAEALAREHAAILEDQKDFTPQRFVALVQSFLDNPVQIAMLEERVAHFHRPNASDEIARLILA